MTYLPTDADLALLNNHSSNIYCRIDMLNKDFITIDSLEGLVIDGSISIDSESDVRRTFNVTLYLGKKSGISSLTEEDWISKNVRVFIGLSGRGMSKISASKSIDEMIKENADYQLAATNYDDLIQAEVIDTKTALNELYNDLFLSYSNSADSSYVNGVKIYWYNEGCYTFTSNCFTYSATENTVQASCVDLVSRINGDLGGQLVGGTHRIEKGTRIGDAIWAVLRDETEFKKYSIDYWSRTVPHDLDYDTGSTVWDILSELRDLYYPFEMYFDDDVFVCKEIPSGFDDPPVLDPETFEKLVTNDGESATVDYAAVRNCVEVFGATIEADGAATVKGWSGTNKTINLVLNATESTWKSETKVSFVAPANVEAAKTDKNGNVTSGAMTVVLTFT